MYKLINKPYSRSSTEKLLILPSCFCNYFGPFRQRTVPNLNQRPKKPWDY
ncbi:hypothetical protein SERLA73DRAFT_142652 [Serpula lacrymans var. lacrymans S7.3]|uniref:Uncharacterized protein n=1 Tax=Serpula lacrymans var. lacrymans (strain S7.3) TaxID=936435 RepID=F8Q856_SERL3|nr:hypothetical protein SERLA73DRAFT_142652 [Serpula lacrymans var. lacrymans S7.3]